MQTVRFNIFNQIHKALRALLYDTSLMTQRTDYTSIRDTDLTISRIREVMLLFDHHADNEDDHVFSALHNIAPELVDKLEREHITDKRLGHAISELLSEFDCKMEPGERIFHGIKLQQAFHEFVGFNLYHMNVEEKEINEALWMNYSDEHIHEIERKILAKITPEESSYTAKWMVLGLNNIELISWLSAVKKMAPPPVTGGLLKLAAKELPLERWAIIEEALCMDQVTLSVGNE